MKTLIFSILTVLLFPQLISAQGKYQKYNPFSGTIVFSVEGGVTLANTDYSGLGIDYTGRASLEYFFPSSVQSGFGLRLFGSTGFLKGDDTSLDPQLIRTSISGFGGGVIFILSINDEIFPYLYAGISNLWFEPKGEGGELLPNNLVGKYSKSEINYNLEIGMRFSVTSNLSLNLAGGIQLSPNDWIDDKAIGTDNDMFFIAMGGISYSFLAKSDYDGDGVIDADDVCPNTPEGIRVDKFGCALDSDNDGVPDHLDACLNTPRNVRVSEDGCPLDSDNDGIPDYTDICPNTPNGIDVDELGCAYDLDADGIPDYMDDCPETPYDVDVDKAGCPMDSDDDGVPDYLDQCPGTLTGMLVDETGCEIVREEPEPVIEAEVIQEVEFSEPIPMEEIILSSESSFDFNSAELKPEAFVLLDKLVTVMKKHPMSRWKIDGHTDNIGSEAGNMKMSKLRADAVVEYFISKDIPSGRLNAEGKGSNEPIAGNDTEEGRQKNRRVVIIRLN
jgi:outer membrane protein OmpA-like peptidoglycan-associated protein